MGRSGKQWRRQLWVVVLVLLIDLYIDKSGVTLVKERRRQEWSDTSCGCAKHTRTEGHWMLCFPSLLNIITTVSKFILRAVDLRVDK